VLLLLGRLLLGPKLAAAAACVRSSCRLLSASGAGVGLLSSRLLLPLLLPPLLLLPAVLMARLLLL
jgi:hypothetical protein